MKREPYNPIIDVLMDQGYYPEEICDIIIHMNDEARSGNNMEGIFDLYNLDIELVKHLNAI